MDIDRAATAFARLVEVMERLRAPGGCPWDREQTSVSLRPYLLEEAYEVLDAIDREDPGALRDELGDLLLQIVFHAEIAAEPGHFDVADVADAIVDKLIRRHPHVFGDVEVSDAAEVKRNWGLIKDREQGVKGPVPLDQLAPDTLPALARAQKIGSKLRRRGFDWGNAEQVLDKLEEELRELRAAVGAGDVAAAGREVGDLLLTATSIARHLETSAEIALRDATRRLLDRVRYVEDALGDRGQRLSELSEDERDAVWREAKARLAAEDGPHQD